MYFRNEYAFLSNMYTCPIKIKMKGKMYTFQCAESAFQACKCPDRADEFTYLSGAKAKQLGRTVDVTQQWGSIEEWNKQRTEMMRIVLQHKFSQHPNLATKLIAIKESIVEENSWNDTYWGMCNGKGCNNLGKLLMIVREKLIELSRT
jgi:ribA/ribD-fused uncharacterized protein